MIKTTNLTKSYGRARGITDLTLHVPAGSCFGFIGPNGAGKSTTIRTLLGLIAPTAGRAEVLGLDCVRDRTAILAQVGYMPSEAMFYPEMRSGEVIRLSADLRKKDCRREAAGLLEALDLDPRKKIRELSLGNRKKVSIVCAMQHRPAPTYSTRSSATATGPPSSGRAAWWRRAPPRSWTLKISSSTTTRGGSQHDGV